MTAKMAAWLIILALVVGMMPIAGAEQAIEPPQAAEEWTSICTGHFHVGLPASWYYDFDPTSDIYAISNEPDAFGPSSNTHYISEGDFTAYREILENAYTEEEIAQLIVSGFFNLSEEAAQSLPMRSDVYGDLTFYSSPLPVGHDMGPRTVYCAYREGYVLVVIYLPNDLVDIDGLLGSVAFDPAGRKDCILRPFACEMPGGWTVTYDSEGAVWAADPVTGDALMVINQEFPEARAAVPTLMTEKKACEAYATGLLGVDQSTPVALEPAEYNGLTCYLLDVDDEVGTRWLMHYYDGYIIAIAFPTKAAIDCDVVFSTLRHVR